VKRERKGGGKKKARRDAKSNNGESRNTCKTQERVQAAQRSGGGVTICVLKLIEDFVGLRTCPLKVLLSEGEERFFWDKKPDLEFIINQT